MLLQRVRTHGCLKLENDTDQREADGQTTTSTAKAELAQRTTLSCQELRVLCWERGLLRCQPGGAAGGKGVGESGGDDDSTLLHRCWVNSIFMLNMIRRFRFCCAVSRGISV